MHHFELLFLNSTPKTFTKENLIELLNTKYIKNIVLKILFKEVNSSIEPKKKIGLRLVKCPITFDAHIKTLKNLLDDYTSDDSPIIGERYKVLTESMTRRLLNEEFKPTYTIEKVKISKDDTDFTAIKVNFNEEFRMLEVL